MVKAGAATDAVIDELVPCSTPVTSSSTAATRTSWTRGGARPRCASHGLHFVGCGVSGGEEGALLGPSIMPGRVHRSPTRSSARSSRSIAAQGQRHGPCLHARRARTAPATSSRWCTTASSTRTCSSSPRPTTCSGRAWGRRRLEIRGRSSAPGTRGTWTRSSSRSPRRCSRTPTPRPGSRSGGAYRARPQAEQKGTGRWTVQSALDLGIPITGIAEATFARALSGHADQRAAARAAFGPR